MVAEADVELIEVGKRMQQAAEEAGISAYDVAPRVDRRPPTVYRWYSGESRPSMREMRVFAQLVGRKASYLWTGQEPLDALLEELAPIAADLPAAWEEPEFPPGVKRELARLLIDYVPVRMLVPEKQRRQAEVGEPVWQEWTAELADFCKEL